MCKKAFVLTLVAVMVCGIVFSGCGTKQDPTLPNIQLDGSSLAGKVEFIDEQTCRMRVTEEDGHYKTNTLIYLTYSSVNDGKTISVGDEVRFSYNYTTDVSEYNSEPHITVDEVSVK